jgi:hypothetical protein
MKQKIHVVQNSEEKIYEGVFYFASADTNPKDRVFVCGFAQDGLQVTAYITLEQVLSELVKTGLLTLEIKNKEGKE